MFQDFDYVVLGQGLAGTALAWQLLWRGKNVCVIDRGTRSSASHVASGLITPITGQRLVQTWNWDTLWPAAVAFYKQIARQTGVNSLHPRRTVRLLRSAAEQSRYAERWLSRLSPLVRQSVPLVESSVFEDRWGGFEMHPAGQLDVCGFLDVSREEFQTRCAYRQADVDLPKDVRIVQEHVELPRLNLRASCLVFCQGFDARTNPWFRNVAFDAAKGEILTVRIPNYHDPGVVHCGVWIAPGNQDLYRVGATYDRERLDSCTTQAGRDDLQRRLRKFLKLPFQVVDQQAAVRPVVVGRHPILGRHPELPQLACLNGLGSKGSLQAPYWSEQLARHLVDGTGLEPAVDLNRRFPGQK